MRGANIHPVQIVATIGPESCSEPALVALRQSGLGMARLNCAHNTLHWHAQTIRRIRRIMPDVPILIDTPGRKIRTGRLAANVELVEGQSIVFTPEVGHDGTDKIPLTVSILHELLEEGDILHAAEGVVRLSVTDISGQDIRCRVERGGTLMSSKGVYCPKATGSLEFMSKRDRDFLAFALEHGVEYLSLSYVESGSEVEEVRQAAGGNGLGLISKIETAGAVARLNEIAEASDWLMIDRRDLWIETQWSPVGILQKEILSAAGRLSKPVIVATETLHSMNENPIPTMAEVLDVTNAVLDGAAALMLSAETAIGRYAVESVAMLRRLIDDAARHAPAAQESRPRLTRAARP